MHEHHKILDQTTKDICITQYTWTYLPEIPEAATVAYVVWKGHFSRDRFPTQNPKQMTQIKREIWRVI